MYETFRFVTVTADIGSLIVNYFYLFLFREVNYISTRLFL